VRRRPSALLGIWSAAVVKFSESSFCLYGSGNPLLKIAPEGSDRHRSPSAAIIETEEDGALTRPDIAEILQNQIIAALKSRKVASEPFQRPPIPDFDLYMAALEKIAAEAEVRSERWRQEAEAELKRAESLETKVAALEQAVKQGEVRNEQWREQAETAAKIVVSLQTNIAALKEDLTEAKTIAQRWRHEAQVTAKRANDLVAELYELTCEHVEMVALRAGPSAI
jgi:chromosome segregation ATPase